MIPNSKNLRNSIKSKFTVDETPSIQKPLHDDNDDTHITEETPNPNYSTTPASSIENKDDSINTQITDSPSVGFFDNDGFKFTNIDGVENTYYHLSDNLLDQTYELPSSDTEAPTTIYLIIYRIITDTIEPYLQFFLIANSETDPLSFPSFTLKTTVDDASSVILSLQDQCNEALYKWKNQSNPNSTVIFDKLYKGFYQDEADNSKVFVLVNITEYPDILATITKDYINKWGVVHELLNTQQIQLQPIDPIISPLFWKKQEIWRISDKDKYNVEYPYLLYLSHEPNGTSNGRKSLYFQSSESMTEMIPLTLPTTYLSSFGDVYLFSCMPILDTSFPNAQLMRFVVFIKENTGETLHIINKNTDITQLKLGNNDNTDKIYNAIYFQEYGTPYFCVYSNTMFTQI
jgi:hypothetical protein